MSSPYKEAGLEIDEDIRHQRKVWIIERVSWVIMALLILAASVGLLGHGPFSSGVLNVPSSGLLVQYERFERMNAQALLRIRLGSQQQQDDVAARLSLGREFLGKVAISHIEPEPAEVEVWPDRLTYVFTRPEPGNSAEVIIHYQPFSFGKVEVRIGLDGYPVQAFGQFIYP